MEGRTDRRMDRLYFRGPFQLKLEVQQVHKEIGQHYSSINVTWFTMKLAFNYNTTVNIKNNHFARKLVKHVSAKKNFE